MSEVIEIEGKEKILKALKDPSLVEVGGTKKHNNGKWVHFGFFKKVAESEKKGTENGKKS